MRKKHYPGKTSGRFNFNIWQDLYNDQSMKSKAIGICVSPTILWTSMVGLLQLDKTQGWYNQLREYEFLGCRLVSLAHR